jgi:hypothetical protein
VFTIAGFHAPQLKVDAPPSDLQAAAQKLCAASHGMPLAIFGGLDRTKLLRIRCPGTGPQVPPPPTTAWESL